MNEFFSSLLNKIGLNASQKTLRQRLATLISTHKEIDHSLSEEENLMIRNILHLNKMTVSDVMIPRADIVSVSRDIKLEALKEVIAKYPFTRLVVYQGTLDDVKGFIHVKDIFQLIEAKNFTIKSIIRKPLLVVESMPILDLLIQMRRTQLPLAIVIDEFGGVDGLVTTWDIVRKLLGEIEESNEPETSSMLKELPGGIFEADARLPIREFQELFGLQATVDEDEDEIDTVGGLIVKLAGRVPDRCELIQHPGGVEFEIVDANPRRVTKVKMRSCEPEVILSSSE